MRELSLKIYHGRPSFQLNKPHMKAFHRKEADMKKEETNEFINMTLEEKKAEIIKMVRDIPDDSPIHKELYEALEREMEEK